ncbi:tetratricopeptide repeat protein [Sphingomonas sp. CGMCC 1.13654]|uniref:Tetratricopeptide repeat protein n=1 Tax=Sphingomonas chungangi TaxID=2683589 RepID=A0A838L2L3_9SPHN|nr:tetratricopeptide repeat protein [Sphingomonas chungangi]MBA2932762.1 tetratricopeptide repeat protein [Sphingomonas chungangi]MVW56384.1 tetratricopeptide repeat protein [Sphingomonas chungangi]
MRLAFIALLLAGTAAPALAQDQSIPGRVDKLEHEMRAVQRKVFPGANPDYFDPQITPQAAPPPDAGSPASSAVSDLSQRVSALEQQVQQFTNQAEENGHRLDVLEQNYSKMKGDTDYRLNALEGHGAPPSPAQGGMVDAGPPPAATVSTSDPNAAPPFGPKGRKPVSGTPAPTMSDESGNQAPPSATGPAAMPVLTKTGDPAEDQYMLGYTLWTQKRYADAETQLKQVAAKYPKHKRASYAQNLLGRAYLDDGQLSEAAKAFYASYKQFPRGERAPDSLYYLGQTLQQLKKNAEACQAYGEFDDVYGATAAPALKARVKQAQTDAKCGA